MLVRLWQKGRFSTIHRNIYVVTMQNNIMPQKLKMDITETREIIQKLFSLHVTDTG